MKLGEIYVWDTDQAQGHKIRRKHQVYLGFIGWPVDAFAFLFISKTNYGCDYEIASADYPFLSLPQSYVSCGGVVSYSEDDLRSFKPRFEGSLSIQHLKELYAAIARSDSIEERLRPLVCNLLKVIL